MIANPLKGYGRLIAVALTGIVVITTAACSTTTSPTTPVPAPTIEIGVPPATTPTPTSPLPPAGAPAEMMEVKVTLTNGVVTLEKSTVDAGPIRFMVKNDGTNVHGFNVMGEGIDQKTADLQPGESAVLDVTLTPGEYEAYCPVPGHRERGMTTMFTVQ